MTIQKELQGNHLGEVDFIFRPETQEDRQALGAIALGFQLHREFAADIEADPEYVDPHEFDGAFEEDYTPRHLSLVEKQSEDLRIPDSEILEKHAEEEEIENMGETMFVKALPLEERIEIASVHNTSLVLSEDEIVGVAEILSFGEDLANKKAAQQKEENKDTIEFVYPSANWTNAINRLMEASGVEYQQAA